MNELNISSLIQIMQEGFVEHDKQESAGRFLLESVALQEDSLCTTDLNSKKISRLVNRKDPVPDDIKQAALKADIAVKVEEYFRQKVIPDINPYTKDDVFQKIMNVIIQDSEIAKRKKDEFQRLYDLGDDAYFCIRCLCTHFNVIIELSLIQLNIKMHRCWQKLHTNVRLVMKNW